MTALGVAQGVRFLLELLALTALAVGGWQLADVVWAGLGLAVGLPLAMVAVWGRWVAPRSAHQLDDPTRLAVEVGVFGTAALVLVATGHPLVAGLLGVSYVVDRLALWLLEG